MTEATLHKIPVNENDVAILHQAMQDLGIKIEYKLAKESRKKLAEHLYTKYGWTELRIANALGVSQQRISEDLEGLPESGKPHRPKGGRPKGSRRPKSKAAQDRARQAVRGKVVAGESVSRKEIGAVVGAGDNTVQLAVAAEEARLELLNELNIDPETLAPSAKAKLEIAKRQIQHSLNYAHAERMRNIDEEVRQRVLKEGKEYLEELRKEREELREEKQLYTDMRKPLYTIDQYNLIRKCLHQSGVAASTKDFDTAFDLIQRKKLQLTGQK